MLCTLAQGREPTGSRQSALCHMIQESCVLGKQTRSKIGVCAVLLVLVNIPSFQTRVIHCLCLLFRD